MRRKDREVTEIQKMREIMDSCKVFRVAMSVKNVPYIIPLNYGYRYMDEHFEFFFHCAKEGKKIEILKENNLVCFEMDDDHELAVADSACAYGYYYRSVIGMGEVTFITDAKEKMEYLSIIMKHQTGGDFMFSEEQVVSVTVCKIKALEITAKQRSKDR